MIYCVWYPSGGFGHFINAVLSMYGRGFARPKNRAKFSTNGDSHRLNLVLPRYQRSRDYQFDFGTLDETLDYSVLVDNGINDESLVWRNMFPGAKIIKLCYTDHSWPIIAKTSIIKAQKVELSDALVLDQNWPSTEDWVIREKYFLYLKNHPLRNRWRPTADISTLPLGSLLDYASLSESLYAIGIEHADFRNFHAEMLTNNEQYFSGVRFANEIIQAILSKKHIPIDHITDLWDQAVVNYFISLRFGIEVPANTYADWFTHTSQIDRIV